MQLFREWNEIRRVLRSKNTLTAALQSKSVASKQGLDLTSNDSHDTWNWFEIVALSIGNDNDMVRWFLAIGENKFSKHHFAIAVVDLQVIILFFTTVHACVWWSGRVIEERRKNERTNRSVQWIRSTNRGGIHSSARSLGCSIRQWRSGRESRKQRQVNSLRVKTRLCMVYNVAVRLSVLLPSGFSAVVSMTIPPCIQISPRYNEKRNKNARFDHRRTSFMVPAWK